MKIERIDTYLVSGGSRNYVFLKVRTDVGIEGVGEAYSCGPDFATVEVIHDFETWLVGEDPRNIEYLWQKMVQFSRFPGGSVVNAAISGIEIALWDILAKELGVPVWRLLGGRCRDRVRVYRHVRSDVEDALKTMETEGITAFKTFPFPPEADRMPWSRQLREAEAHLGRLREAFGSDVDIGVDLHAKVFEPARALQIAEAIRPHDPFFLEEPIKPENIDAMAYVRSRSPVPIATGEQLYTKYQFRELLVRGAADIVQPDVCVCGGLGEMKRIAAMAEAFYVPVAPHNPLGPVATAVNVHFAVSTQNFLILEHLPDRGARAEWVVEPMPVVDGAIPIPAGPGYGIELNEAAFERYPARRWHRGFSYRADGSVAYI
ncbi:MAG: isomerase [Candidatus Poribacteria bacterium]|nr:MAG: isomerase [Candidatus Poribacteria bacterium]